MTNTTSGWGGDVPGGGAGFVKPGEWEGGKRYRFRILAEPVQGYVGWTKDKRPVRRATNSFSPGEVVQDEQNRISYFRAAPVWDYTAKRIRVWEIRQVTILKELKNLATNPEWGDPVGYDIEVVKETGAKVSYSVTAIPPKQAAPEILAEWTECQAGGFDINQLFAGGDPFNGWSPGADSVPF